MEAAMHSSKKLKPENSYQNAARLIAFRKWFLVKGVARLEHFEEDLLAYANTIGVPSDRDGGIAVWPVIPRASQGTFSETAAVAPYHTDAQYRDDPESAFVLGCRVPANDGGISKLLSVEDLMIQFKGPDWTSEEVDLLTKPIWRWRVPTVFQRDVKDTHSNPGAILLPNGGIRWRFDNLVAPSPFAETVAAKLDATIENCPASEQIEMIAGDVLVASNVFALHARTAFSDLDRCYYRVRLK